MDDDMAYIRKVIEDIARDYKLSPKVAQALLLKILAILQSYREENDKHEGAEEL